MSADLERIRVLVDRLAGRDVGRKEPVHVLLVEDECRDVEMMVRVLDQLQCQTSIASDGNEAVMRIMDDSVTLVFLDLNLPANGPTGLDILKKLRADRPGLPVVIMSGGNLTSLKEAVDLGPIIVAPKPVPPDQIEHVINNIPAFEKVNGG